MFQKIRRRLTYIYAGIMAVFFILLVFGTHKSMLWSITSEQEREVLLYLEEEAYEHLMLFQNKKAFGVADNDADSKMYYYLYDNEANLLDAERADKNVEKVMIEEVEKWNAQKNEVITLESNGYKVMMASMPLILNGEKVGTIYVGCDITDSYRTQNKSRVEQENELLLFLEEEAYEHLVLFQNIKVLANDDNDGNGRMYYYVYDNEANLLEAERADENIEKAVIEKIEHWDVKKNEVITLESDEYKIMMASTPIVVNGEQVGVIYVGRDVTAIYRGQQKSIIILVFFSITALILATIAGYFMAGRAIVPIKTAYEKQRQFTADASHELRTPLSVVMSSIDVLQNDTGPMSPFIKQVIEDMKDETKRMAKLVADLLAIARNDTYGIELSKQKFDVIEVIEQVIRKMQPLAQAKNIQLYFAKQPMLEFYADMERIKQLLVILVDNAIKYTPENGVVTIKAGYGSDGRKVKLMITDTGIGIPKEDQMHIFDRFYRVDKARARESGGAGLGLAIAKGIVQLHGGEIRIESNVDSGSTFSVVLPI